MPVSRTLPSIAALTVFIILGGFCIDAAWRWDPSAVGGTGDALRWLGHGVPLAIVSAGLVAFGLLQLAEAGFRRIDCD